MSQNSGLYSSAGCVPEEMLVRFLLLEVGLELSPNCNGLQ